jgi:beta-lactam-binding protein with PASTA domain
MARVRRREEQIPAGPPRVPPPWYRDIWPWLLALGVVVLALIGGYVGYQAYQDDNDSSSESVVTVTQTIGTETTETTTTTSSETTTTVAEPPPAPVTVPDVVGQNYVEAGSTLEGMGLAADSYPVASQETRGSVAAQRPAPGTVLKEGDIVRNNVALGTGARETKEVPDVTGPQASDARATARRAGFTVRTVYRQAPSAEESGEVLTQQPAPGTPLPELTQITVFVGQ